MLELLETIELSSDIAIVETKWRWFEQVLNFANASMDPSVFNTVNVLEYLLNESGQLWVNLSKIRVILLEKRLRIGIIGIASTIWSLAFFRLFWDVIHGGLFVQFFPEIRDSSADRWTKSSALSFEQLFHCFWSLLS